MAHRYFAHFAFSVVGRVVDGWRYGVRRGGSGKGGGRIIALAARAKISREAQDISIAFMITPLPDIAAASGTSTRLWRTAQISSSLASRPYSSCP